MSDDIDKAFGVWYGVDVYDDMPNDEKTIRNISEASFKAGAQHQAAQADKLAEALEPFVQQYRHLTDEEIRKVSGKSFSERYIKARTALKAYRGD